MHRQACVPRKPREGSTKTDKADGAPFIWGLRDGGAWEGGGQRKRRFPFYTLHGLFPKLSAFVTGGFCFCFVFPDFYSIM